MKLIFYISYYNMQRHLKEKQASIIDWGFDQIKHKIFISSIFFGCSQGILFFIYATLFYFGSYLVDNKILYRYRKVEDSGEYEPIDISTGTLSFDNFIYISVELAGSNDELTPMSTLLV